MITADLFYRLAKLSTDETLAKILHGVKVRVGNEWFTIGNGLLFYNSKGVDFNFSDLNTITAVDWTKPPEVKIPPPEVKIPVPGAK